MNVEELGGRGLVKWVIKWVTILTLFSVGPRQKITAKKIRQGKDGRRIAPRKDASEELGGRDLVKQVIKWVTILTLFSLGPRQKITAKKIRQGKDGRRIAPRKDA